MTTYEHLEQFATNLGIIICTDYLRNDDPVDGMYIGFDGFGYVIFINRHRSQARRTVALAEELGHHFQSTGDIAALNSIQARKQELLGRRWSYDQLLPPDTALEYLKKGGTPWDLAEDTNLPDDFVDEALRHHLRRRAQ